MTTLVLLENFLNCNGKYTLPPLPKDLTDLGIETNLILRGYFHELYTSAHSIYLDAKRAGDKKTEEYEKRESDFFAAEQTLSDLAKRSKSSVLLPVICESTSELDFSDRLSEYGDSFGRIIFCRDEKGKSIARAERTGIDKRRYLTGIPRNGFKVLFYDEAIRKLWISLLLRNSLAARNQVRALGSAYVANQLNIAIEKFGREMRL